MFVVENNKFEYFYFKLFIHRTMVKDTSLRKQRNPHNPRRVKLLVQHVEIPKNRDFQVDKFARVKFALYFNAVAQEITRTVKRAVGERLRSDFLGLTLEEI
jgi:hypothetical protein